MVEVSHKSVQVNVTVPSKEEQTNLSLVILDLRTQVCAAAGMQAATHGRFLLSMMMECGMGVIICPKKHVGGGSWWERGVSRAKN